MSPYLHLQPAKQNAVHFQEDIQAFKRRYSLDWPLDARQVSLLESRHVAGCRAQTMRTSEVEANLRSTGCTCQQVWEDKGYDPCRSQEHQEIIVSFVALLIRARPNVFLASNTPYRTPRFTPAHPGRVSSPELFRQPKACEVDNFRPRTAFSCQFHPYLACGGKFVSCSRVLTR